MDCRKRKNTLNLNRLTLHMKTGSFFKALLIWSYKQDTHFILFLFFTKLSEDDKVKLTDVGASKAVADITGTLAGTPVYIAPEVTRFDIYEFRADIYSLGIMLWEMWYGQQVFLSVEVSSIQDLFAKVQDGLRPEHAPHYLPPSPAWKGLMEWCWSKNPKERPNAQQCNQAITKVIMPLP